MRTRHSDPGDASVYQWPVQIGAAPCSASSRRARQPELLSPCSRSKKAHPVFPHRMDPYALIFWRKTMANRNHNLNTTAGATNAGLTQIKTIRSQLGDIEDQALCIRVLSEIAFEQ